MRVCAGDLHVSMRVAYFGTTNIMVSVGSHADTKQV